MTEDKRDSFQPRPPEDLRTTAGIDAATASGTVGGYKLVRKIGIGGMGVVYEAEQQRPHRAVALKLVRGGPLLDPRGLKLFEREAQALAMLKHPGIAAIYETGCTTEGRHYFAMELVRGQSLTEYLIAAGFGVLPSGAELKKRLNLFLRVCDELVTGQLPKVLDGLSL